MTNCQDLGVNVKQLDYCDDVGKQFSRRIRNNDEAQSVNETWKRWEEGCIPHDIT